MKCQNLKVSESIFVSILKVSESESVRTWKCQNLKVSDPDSVRMIWNMKVSEFQGMKFLQNRKVSESECVRISFFCKGALFRGKGGPPVLEKPAQHLPRQGRGFVRPPVCPTPPTISSSYGGPSGGQLTDCWHQMSSYDQYILFLCCCIVCHMSSMSGLVGAV